MLDLREIIELKKENIKEGKDRNILFKIHTPFIRTNKLNSNDREYPEDVTSLAIRTFGEKIKNQKILSQVNHPDGVHPDVDKVSHIVDDIAYDKREKRGYVTLSVLNTSAGRDLKTILDTGAKMGVSLRAKGTVGHDKKVQSDLELFGVDIVSSPSFGEDATFDKASIFESYTPEEKKEESKMISQKQFLSEVNDLLEVGFKTDENAKEWDRYIDENTERVVRIVKQKHEEAGNDLSAVFEDEPKEDLQLKERQKLSALYRDAQRGGFTGNFAEWLVLYQKVEKVEPITKKKLTEDEKKQDKIRQKIMTEFIAGKVSKIKK